MKPAVTPPPDPEKPMPGADDEDERFAPPPCILLAPKLLLDEEIGLMFEFGLLWLLELEEEEEEEEDERLWKGSIGCDDGRVDTRRRFLDRSSSLAEE